MLATCLPPSNHITSEPATAEWCAVQVYGSCEKAVAEILAKRGIEYYLPLQSMRRIRRGRAETVSRPFYEGYLFAQYGDEHERHEIRRTRYVADLLLTQGHRQTIFAREITDLKRALEIEPIGDATPWANEVGRYVLVASGPFAGIHGKIIRRCRRMGGLTVFKDVLCVGVFMLGRMLEVEIDPLICVPMLQVDFNN